MGQACSDASGNNIDPTQCTNPATARGSGGSCQRTSEADPGYYCVYSSCYAGYYTGGSFNPGGCDECSDDTPYSCPGSDEYTDCYADPPACPSSVRIKKNVIFWQPYKDQARCPVEGEIVCHDSPTSAAFECIDITSNVESCGGCQSLDQGSDCTSIENAMGVSCDGGRCIVHTCVAGFAVNANGTACVNLNDLD